MKRTPEERAALDRAALDRSDFTNDKTEIVRTPMEYDQ